MKILIAEDNEDSRNLLRKQLHAYGHEVTTTANGVEALQQASKEAPDILVTDILMPKMDGYQLCHECKQNDRLKDIPFIFYTATYTSDEDEQFALSLGANAFIRKPAEPDVLAQTLSEVFEKAKAGLLPPAEVAPPGPSLYLSEYNKRLVAKLDKRVAQLQESKELLQTLFDNVLDGMLVVDYGGKILNANAALARMFDLESVDDGIGRDALEFVLPEFHEIAINDLANIEAGRGGYLRAYKVRSKSEKEFWIEGVGTDIILEGKHVDLICVRDITERIKAEEERQQNTEKLLAAMQGTIQALTATVEIRDPYTAGHQQRVANLAYAIATEMGLTAEQVKGIHTAGIIHDIGKEYVPAEILSKPGRLSEDEFGLIKVHPQAGYDILKPIEFPWPIAQIVLQHHERMDGSGYPSGLSGEDILLEARTLAVADVVEAMTSHRPYRPALGIDKALEEISQNKGTLYDPEAVDACLRLFTEKGFNFE